MEATRNNSPAESTVSKPKSRNAYPDNGNTSREEPHSSSIGNGTRYESCNEHRRNQTKGRDRSNEKDRDWNRDRDRDRSSHVRCRDIFRGKDGKGGYREDSKPYPYPYNTTADGTFGDVGRRGVGRLQNIQPYPTIPQMNSNQWPRQMDGMNMKAGSITLNPTANMNLNHTLDQAGPNISTYPYLGMPPEHNMYGMMNIGNYGQFQVMNTDPNIVLSQIKEPIHLSSCVLYPPHPNAPIPPRNEKPLGCKTVYVGGLPLNMTSEIIAEIFGGCGSSIKDLRMGKKDYCHIEFSCELSVENALLFSGYTVKIENKEEQGYVGTLVVNYPNSSEHRKYENRVVQREMQVYVEPRAEYFQSQTPPLIHYSDYEAQILSEKLRSSSEFQDAVNVLITWLERGECNKRNAGFFYSMIQSANSQVSRLMLDKSTFENELNKAKMKLKQQMQDILLQLNEIGKVFAASCVQKVWDHFTKAQRKHIELWKKQTEETKNAHVEEVLNDRIEDEMDINDDDEEEEEEVSPENVQADRKTVTDQYGNEVDAVEEVTRLKEESESLRCQLEAYENEAVLLRTESEQAKEIRDSQMQALRQAVQGMQKELIMLRQKRVKDEAELKELRNFKKSRRDTKSDKEDKEIGNEIEERLEDGKKDISDGVNVEECFRDTFSSSVTSSSTNIQNITENEAHLIGLISIFLNVHPFGASLEYTCSYLNQIDCTVKSRDIESLMRKFPSVFKEECTGIGASLEKKWTFSGF